MPDSYEVLRREDGVGLAPFQSTPTGVAAVRFQSTSQVHLAAHETRTGFDVSDRIVRMTRIVIEWAIAVPDS